MTCPHAQEQLLDLLYGELPVALAAELQTHLAACPGCAEEFARLRRGRAALQRLIAQEPGESAICHLPFAIADAEPAQARPPGLSSFVFRLSSFRPWLWGATAAAAALFVLVLLLDRTPPVVAQTLPIEVQRTGVSLTILSRPPEWDAYGDDAGLTDVQSSYAQMANVSGVTANLPVTDGRTINAGESGPHYHAWPGLALVRDQRLIRHVPTGDAEVRCTEVPAGIWPDTVRLRDLDDRAGGAREAEGGAEGGLTIREQNYQYDLASADTILTKYIDHPITVRFQDGSAVTGALLSHDAATLVLRPDNAGPQTLARAKIAAIGFAALPSGLRTTPTLVWKMHSPAPAAERPLEVDYLTTGLSWHADYVLKLQPAPKAPARGDIIDHADLIGYATVVNHSGVTFQDAQLKLMAGDVNLLMHPTPVYIFLGLLVGQTESESKSREPQLVEKSFFEYHLYTLTRPTTLANQETKQLEMVTGQNLPLRRAYLYDPTGHPTAVQVVSEIDNTEPNGLGKPLPKGAVRLYAPDPEGVSTYVSQTQIDHTPVKEKLRLPWGHAFDLVGQQRETDAHHNGPDHQITTEYSLRNHKDYPVTITVLIHVPATTYLARCDLPWHVREVGLVEVTAAVPANQETKFMFHYAFNDQTGGGLHSPAP